jgi:hypothetical protein
MRMIVKLLFSFTDLHQQNRHDARCAQPGYTRTPPVDFAFSRITRLSLPPLPMAILQLPLGLHAAPSFSSRFPFLGAKFPAKRVRDRQLAVVCRLQSFIRSLRIPAIAQARGLPWRFSPCSADNTVLLGTLLDSTSRFWDCCAKCSY